MTTRMDTKGAPRINEARFRTLAVAAICGFACAAAGQSVSYTKMLDWQSAVPGYPTGWLYMSLGGVENGEFAFTASNLTDPDPFVMATKSYVFRAAVKGGPFTVIATEGDPVPAASPYTFIGFMPPALHDGRVAFVGSRSGLSHAGLYEGSGGPLTRILDYPTSGLKPALEVSSDAAGFAFRTNTMPGEPVFFVPPNGQPVLVASRGMPAPGGGTFVDFYSCRLQDGLLVFDALYGGPQSGYAIFSWDPGTGAMSRIADTDMTMPGTSVPFAIVRDPTTNGQDVFFVGSDGAGWPNSRHGIYRWHKGAIEPVVDFRTPRPDAPGTFQTFREELSVTDSGRTVAFSTVDGVYAYRNGKVLPVVLHGQSFAGQPVVQWAQINPASLDGDHLAFRVSFGALDTQVAMWIATLPPEGGACYADCNADGALTVADFGCFQTKFVAADPYADCSGDGTLTVADFGCFQTAFVAGCP